MSLVEAAPSPATPPAPTGAAAVGPPGPPPRRRDLLRRHRGLLGVAAAVLAVVVLLTVVSTRASGRTGYLDPQNPGPAGAQAVARVLVGHGVRVLVLRDAAQLAATTVDRRTTLLVTGSENLGRRSAAGVRRQARSARAAVLVSPSPVLLHALSLPVRTVGGGSGGHPRARCGDPLLAGLTLEAGEATGYDDRVRHSVTACFPVASVRRISLLVRVGGRVPTYVVGASEVLANRAVTGRDNAAVALRLLGQADRLVWYVPDARDVVPGDTSSVRGQLPGGLVPGLWLVGAAVLATMLWRGRRLGPLVVEPLPVSVRAVESTQGRGRLYRRVHDRAHAAGVLRTSTARRLATRLRLPPGTDPQRLAEAVAAAAGSDPRSVLDVLVHRPVADDTALTRLADDLAALEREVHP